MLFETPRTLSTQSLFPYRKSFFEEPKGSSQSAAPCFYGVALSVQCLWHLLALTRSAQRDACIMKMEQEPPPRWGGFSRKSSPPYGGGAGGGASPPPCSLCWKKRIGELEKLEFPYSKHDTILCWFTIYFEIYDLTILRVKKTMSEQARESLRGQEKYFCPKFLSYERGS